MLKIKVTGLNETIKRFEDLAKKAQQLHGEHSVPLEQLLNAAFMGRNTRFSSLEELIAGSRFKVETTEDFEAIPGADWDNYINGNTKFANWNAMLHAARDAWVKGKLGL